MRYDYGLWSLVAAARFAMEFFRGDSPVVAGIIVPQAMSALLVAAGQVGLWLLRQPASRFNGSARA